MSLDEYNRHAMLGPLAGPATTASSIAGQEAYKQAHDHTVTVSAVPEKPLTISGTLLTLGALVVVGGAAMAGAFFLPETLAQISGFIALMSLIGFVIVSIFVGIEGAKLGLRWIFDRAIEKRWWRFAIVPVATFVFAVIYSYGFGSFDAWMVALFATVLMIAAKCVAVLRPASIALAVGIVTYVLSVSHVFDKHNVLAALIACVATAATLAAAYALRRQQV